MQAMQAGFSLWFVIKLQPLPDARIAILCMCALLRILCKFWRQVGVVEP